MLRRGIASAFVVGVLVAGACRAPTQVTLDVTTNARCAGQTDRGGDVFVDVGVAVGASLGEDGLASRGGDDHCEALGSTEALNWVGDLVIVPGDAEGNTAEVVVVAGVERPNTELTGDARRADAETCLALLGAPGGVEGKACVVSRRIVGFVSNEQLTLPILLSTQCVGVDCGEDETCSNGACVTARIPCDAASGACGRPEGEGGGGQGGRGGSGEGGQGGGAPACEDAACITSCAEVGEAGRCEGEVCTCGGCTQGFCDGQCELLGEGLVGTCSDERCLCRAACDEVSCAESCPAGRLGTCQTDGRCTCDLCEDDACGVDCDAAGLDTGTANCAGDFQCICGASCQQNSDCNQLCLGSLGLEPFCNQNVVCQCLCENVACDAGCVGEGFAGGTCEDSSCVCSTCPASCTEAPCNGTCTAAGCECAG